LVSARSSELAAPAADLLPVRVLIVEDNPHIIEMYTYVLRKLAVNELHGPERVDVRFAADGEEALAQLAVDPFHLVLLDLYMPTMDGFELIKRIRAQEALRTLPLVAISAGGTDAEARALALGADFFLPKPVRFAEVMDTVKRLLGLS
jgi:CheY-like chemotaxis protein